MEICSREKRKKIKKLKPRKMLNVKLYISIIYSIFLYLKKDKNSDS